LHELDDGALDFDALGVGGGLARIWAHPISTTSSAAAKSGLDTRFALLDQRGVISRACG
jgi:hypothetical protein